ncbi:MAG: DNA repair protein RadC, partial [Chloroflexota bacterium]
MSEDRGVERPPRKPRPDYLEHRERLRKRFCQSGGEGLLDYELLELLLTYALPRINTKPLARELIRRFGSLAGVLDATPQETDEVHGIGPASAALVGLLRQLLGRYLADKMRKKDLLTSPQAAADFARVKLAAFPHEAFMIIYLNTKNEAVDHQVIHEGTVDKAIIYPRRIVEAALIHHAAGLLLVHNHPSGHPQPSAEDKQITQTIAEATRAIDIRVVD